MKKIFFVLFFVFFACVLNAQNWVANFDKAKELAKTENKNILLIFEGSDWCPPCKKLNKNLLNTEEFKKFTEDQYVLVKADFLKRSPISESQMKQNERLKQQYNPKRKLPRLFVLSPDGSVLGKMGYKKISPKAYIEALKNFSEKKY